jgi:hypothetical protein
MSMRNFLRIWWARLRGQEAVVLLDFHGDIYYSRARIYPNAGLIESWVFPTYKIGSILLLEDGTVTKPNGNPHFVEQWVYLDRCLRVEQILKGVEGFKF